MYYPYFRGKQYELIAIRENAELLQQAGFIPIIEPVREAFNGLEKTLSMIEEADGGAIVIVNPHHGDHSNNGDTIVAFLSDNFSEYSKIKAGVLLTEEMSVDDVEELCSEFVDDDIVFIHAGFTQARLLAEFLGDNIENTLHIFNEDNCGKLYQKHFKDTERVLLRDGFEKRTNRKHPPVEFFSDLHATFEDEGMNGFGDFLMVGDAFSEGGGPAYAIAIHITFIDPDKDHEMHIHHFKSIRQDDPKDPAGKFAEALTKLVDELEKPDTKILRTDAISELVELHERGHFPGLGYVKKLSMKHHMETLADYLV